MTAYVGGKIIPLRKLRVLCALCGEIIVNLRKSCHINYHCRLLEPHEVVIIAAYQIDIIFQLLLRIRGFIKL